MTEKLPDSSLPSSAPLESARDGGAAAASPTAELPRRRRTTTVGPTMPSRKSQRRLSNPQPKGWWSWWPVYAGLGLGFFAPQLRTLLEPYAPWGMRAAFPFVQFFGLREIGMSTELTRTLPQLMLYLQFPAEGLLMRGALARDFSPGTALTQIAFLHAIAVLVLWIVAMGS